MFRGIFLTTHQLLRSTRIAARSLGKVQYKSFGVTSLPLSTVPSSSNPALELTGNELEPKSDNQIQLLTQKIIKEADVCPITEEELKRMCHEVLSLSNGDNIGGPENDRLQIMIDSLHPIRYVEEDIHRKILAKVMAETEKDDIIHQAMIVAREIGQRHLSLNVYNLLVYIHGLNGQAEEAAAVVKMIQEMEIRPNEKTFTFLMNAYSNSGQLDKVLETFSELKRLELPITINAYGILIKSYAIKGKLEDAFRTYELAKRAGLTPSQPIFGTLIGVCIEQGQLDRAWGTFDHMRLNVAQPDIISFTLMIKACAQNKEAERALKLFEELTEMGLVPIQQTFNALLNACASRPDYYEQALHLLDIMTTQYGFKPDLYTLNILLHAAQVGGRLAEARTFFKNILLVADGTEAVGVAYTNLFFAYAKAFPNNKRKINNFRNQPESYLMELGLVKHENIIELLNRKCPEFSLDATAEARLIAAHMERAFGGSNQQLAWPRAAYLTIHTNYSNYLEALELFEKYSKLQPQHITVYTNMLTMCFRLRQKDNALNLLDEVLNTQLAPLRPKSGLSPLEKRELKKRMGYRPNIILNLYRVMINGLARVNLEERALQLLEEAHQDSDLQPLHLKHFETLYQAILTLEAPELLQRMLRVCPDLPSEDPLVKSKTQLRHHVSGLNAQSSLRVSHKRRIQIDEKLKGLRPF